VTVNKEYIAINVITKSTISEEIIHALKTLCLKVEDKGLVLHEPKVCHRVLQEVTNVLNARQKSC
jgi:hypothetical protein